MTRHHVGRTVAGSAGVWRSLPGAVVQTGFEGGAVTQTRNPNASQSRFRPNVDARQGRTATNSTSFSDSIGPSYRDAGIAARRNLQSTNQLTLASANPRQLLADQHVHDPRAA
jgi:hypothetical protein